MDVRIIESSGQRDELFTQYDSSLQILKKLRERAGKSDNLPGYESLSRLIQLIEDESLDQDEIPVKQIFSSIKDFRQGQLSSEDFLIRVLDRLESFAGKLKILRISEDVEVLRQQLQARANEIAEEANIPLVDFKEIPKANESNGEQDMFELFAGEFFDALGYTIEESPSRGADHGKDIIVLEPLDGIFDTHYRRWLVSCKHKAHSGRSVSVKEDNNIRDRIDQHKCDGFIAFYSTLPSSGLAQRLADFRNRSEGPISVNIFDNARIARLLLNEGKLQLVFARYFRRSFLEHQKKQIVFEHEQELLVIEYEYQRRKEEAIRRQDAIAFRQAEREYQRKQKHAEKQRELRLKQLEE